jgi:hypothetical protein
VGLVVLILVLVPLLLYNSSSNSRLSGLHCLGFLEVHQDRLE